MGQLGSAAAAEKVPLVEHQMKFENLVGEIGSDALFCALPNIMGRQGGTMMCPCAYEMRYEC